METFRKELPQASSIVPTKLPASVLSVPYLSFCFLLLLRMDGPSTLISKVRPCICVPFTSQLFKDIFWAILSCLVSFTALPPALTPAPRLFIRSLLPAEDQVLLCHLKKHSGINILVFLPIPFSVFLYINDSWKSCLYSRFPIFPLPSSLEPFQRGFYE